MTPQELLKKAGRALESARALLALNDVDGACNRAYYAMFDAARAALLLKNPDIGLETIKTHQGLITKFGLHMVKTGSVSPELGKTLNKTQDIRLIADYSGDLITEEQAHWVVTQADIFVTAIHKLHT